MALTKIFHVPAFFIPVANGMATTLCRAILNHSHVTASVSTGAFSLQRRRVFKTGFTILPVCSVNSEAGKQQKTICTEAKLFCSCTECRSLSFLWMFEKQLPVIHSKVWISGNGLFRLLLTKQ